MSNAVLAFWICGSGLIAAAGTLVVSVAAHRRWTLRRLSELSRDITHLRLRLEQFERTAAGAVQARVRAPATSSPGPQPSANSAHILEPGSRRDEAASIPKRIARVGAETVKSVAGRQVSDRLEQLVQFMHDRARRSR